MFDKQLNIYPNPVDKNLVIDFNDSNQNLEFYIYDMNGRLKLHTAKRNIDVSNFNSGVYIIRAFSGEKGYHGKFLKVD